MKKVLKYSGIISLAAAVVAFILMMSTPAVSWTATVLGKSSTNYLAGVNGIFGGENIAIAWTGLVAWILAIIGLLLVALGLVIPFAKNKTLNKVAGVLNLVSVCVLVAAGVLMFFEVPAFTGANGNLSGSISGVASASYALGAGWVIAGIIYIVAGAFALLPALADFKSKK